MLALPEKAENIDNYEWKKDPDTDEFILHDGDDILNLYMICPENKLEDGDKMPLENKVYIYKNDETVVFGVLKQLIPKTKIKDLENLFFERKLLYNSHCI